MKKITKILSAILALTMILAVCVMPSSAAAENKYNEHVTAHVEATPDGTTAGGQQIYKIEVYFNSTNSVQNIHMFLSWDSAAFQLLNATTKVALPNMAMAIPTMIVDQKDPDSPFYMGTAYTENSGFYMGQGVHADSGIAMFPNDTSQPKSAKIDDSALGSELLSQGYTGIYWNWTGDYNVNTLLVSGGQKRGYSSPLSGEQKILTFYLSETANAPEGTYTIGMNEAQVSRLEGSFTWNDDVDTKSIGPQMLSSYNTKPGYDQAEWFNITNATITIGEEESSIISHLKDQIRFPGAAAGAYEGKFQVRTLATITTEDFLKTFESEENAKEVIEKIGFVYKRVSNGEAFTVEEVKDYLNGGSLPAGSADAPVDYISTAFGDYAISCLIDEIPDADYTDGVYAVAYIKTADKVYCYDTVYTGGFEELYTRNAPIAGVPTV